MYNPPSKIVYVVYGETAAQLTVYQSDDMTYDALKNTFGLTPLYCFDVQKDGSFCGAGRPRGVFQFFIPRRPYQLSLQWRGTQRVYEFRELN